MNDPKNLNHQIYLDHMVDPFGLSDLGDLKLCDLSDVSDLYGLNGGK